MKKLAFAIALAALAVCAEMFTEPVAGGRDQNQIPYCGKVVCASIGATNSAAFNLGVAHAFAFGTNSVFVTNAVYTGTAAKGVTNVVLSAPVYVKPGDRWVCYGVGATNGAAKAEVFIER